MRGRLHRGCLGAPELKIPRWAEASRFEPGCHSDRRPAHPKAALKSINLLQPTAAAMLVWRSFFSLSAAGAAELCC
jgi:hypothetical protein